MKINVLYVDDIRQPNIHIYDLTNTNIDIVTNYVDAINKLNTNMYQIIDLDHDLGEDKTGYDICKYIIEHNIKCSEYRIHTSNVVGRQNMTQLLSRYTDSIIKQY